MALTVQMITLQTGSSILEILKDEFKITAYWKCAKPLWDNDQDVVYSHLAEFNGGET